MSLLKTLAFTTALVSAQVDISSFQQWMQTHGKVYHSEQEQAYRFSVFQDNANRAAYQNAANIANGGEAVHGATKFSDMTHDEFRVTYLNYRPQPSNVTRVTPQWPAWNQPIANDIDWRNNNAVTSVKDQGQCGSCWAFGATEAIESYAFLNGGYKLTTLAPQQIVSCDKTSYGCQGGWTEHAYNYVVGAGGIETESSYPYTSGTHGVTGRCQSNPANFAISIRGYTAVTAGESNLAVALNSGPPAICVCADNFQTYTSGVLTSCCSQVDHCVQAVGYTSSYWLVRNSWGTNWGEAGYIRIARGSDLCKISDDVNFPNF